MPGRQQRGRWGGRHGGPRLPAELRDEMGMEAGPSRKPYRSTPKDRPARNDDHEQPSKRAQRPKAAEVEAQRPAGRPHSIAPLKRESSQTNLAEPPAKKHRKAELKLPKSKALDAEEQEIEWLEYMLRKEKGKSKANEIDDDGLDDILDFTDLIGPGGAGLEGEEDRSDEGEEDDSDVDYDEDGETGDEGVADDEDANPDSQQDSTTKTPLDDGSQEPASANPSASRYMPPHLRAAALEAKEESDSAKVEALRKLERRIQGLLNKLSEANIESILGEIEGLYREHSRHDTTATITELILSMISNRSNLLDSFVILYASLVGALYRIIGLEFGAHFLTTLVKRYSASKSSPLLEAPSSIYETPDASKISLNLLTLIAELYNAQVISAKLIYDLVTGFIKAEQAGAVMGEAETESLLKVLKVCGNRLRSDDPGSLNDIVNLVNERVKGREKEMTVRARFMVETLLNLKSGKSKASKAAGESDSLDKMKKFLGGLGRKQRLLAHEPLNVSLAELLDEKSKGKWWLVGAAWAGNPLVEHQDKKSVEKPVKKAGDDLLELARKQGMNTDIRRTIFVTLMTSEDYVHACDRLSALRLTEVQQRECVRVALHCCAIESSYNPFYTLVLEQLALLSHNHRYTLQYALWDFLRDLEGNDDPKAAKKAKNRSMNMAKAMAYIIARDTMDFTVLKAVEFTAARKMTRTFVFALVTHVVLATQTNSPLFAIADIFDASTLNKSAIQDVFEKALVNPDVAQGLSYIIRRNAGTGKDAVMLDMSGAAAEVVRRGLKIAQTTLTRST